LPGVCAAEGARRLDGTGRVGEQSNDRAGGVGPHPEHRRGGADHERANDTPAVRGASGQGPVGVVEPPGPEAAAASPAAARLARNVEPTLGVESEKTLRKPLPPVRNCGSWATLLNPELAAAHDGPPCTCATPPSPATASPTPTGDSSARSAPVTRSGNRPSPSSANSMPRAASSSSP